MADPLSSIPGVSSGVDWKSLVDQIITLDRRPAVQMETKIADNKKRKDALEQFRQAMAALKTAADALKNGSALDAFGATAVGTDASGRNVVSAAASGSAAPGTYTLQVQKLASAQKTVGSVAFPSATTNLSLAGRLVIGGQNVDVVAGDTLTNVRDKINLVSGTTNVQATLVAENADGSGQHLVLSGLKTGAAYAFTPTDDPANAQSLVTALGIGGAPQTPAQDAVVLVDNTVTVSRPTNTIGDAIPGVTLTLGAQGTSTLTVTRQNTAGSNAVQSFVDAYNAVQTFVKKNADDPTSPLARDSLLRGARSNLSQATLGTLGTAPADMSRLANLGVSLQKDGSLKFDSAAWNAVYPSRLDDVKALLADRVGAIAAFADDVTLPYAGQIDSRESAMDTQGASLQRHIDDIDARLEKKRAALLAQYSKSEAMLGRLKSIGDSLTAQLNGLNNSNNNN